MYDLCTASANCVIYNVFFNLKETNSQFLLTAQLHESYIYFAWVFLTHYKRTIKIENQQIKDGSFSILMYF